MNNETKLIQLGFSPEVAKKLIDAGFDTPRKIKVFLHEAKDAGKAIKLSQSEFDTVKTRFNPVIAM